MNKNGTRRITSRLYRLAAQFLSSKWFFCLLLIAFAAETSWLALTSSYPMAFDESYHFQLIQFFSHHLNPLVSSQPASTYELGNIMHNPSWLYHYLLSFPYRLVSEFSQSLQVQVISLRFINIALALTSLGLARKLLRQLGFHAGLSNFTVLLFAFTPVFTVLSAQINYDNLTVLSSIWAVYLTVLCLQKFQKRRELSAGLLLSLLIVCLFASLVKYGFLPIFVGVILTLSWVYGRAIQRKTFSRRSFVVSFHQLNVVQKVSLLIVTLLGFGLFGAFYGVNTIKYHNPVPQCNQVLTIADCTHYYAWDRNYELAQNLANVPPRANIFIYTYHWSVAMWYNLYSEIIPTGGVIPIARNFYAILIGLTIVATACTLSQLKRIFCNYPLLIPITFIVCIYLLFLWGRNYHDYSQLGVAVAVQSRYLAPILLYYYLLLALGVSCVLRGRHLLFRFGVTATASIVVISFVLYGGYVRYASEISPGFRWQPKAPSLENHTEDGR